jgi:hypothetical protein
MDKINPRREATEPNDVTPDSPVLNRRGYLRAAVTTGVLLGLGGVATTSAAPSEPAYDFNVFEKWEFVEYDDGTGEFVREDDKGDDPDLGECLGYTNKMVDGVEELGEPISVAMACSNSERQYDVLVKAGRETFLLGGLAVGDTEVEVEGELVTESALTIDLNEVADVSAVSNKNGVIKSISSFAIGEVLL